MSSSSETYRNAADAMAGPMDPKTPCGVMPTRPCVMWNDPAAHTEDRSFPVEQCTDVCWRYSEEKR